MVLVEVRASDLVFCFLGAQRPSRLNDSPAAYLAALPQLHSEVTLRFWPINSLERCESGQEEQTVRDLGGLQFGHAVWS